jgi:hypothetical protein
LTNVPTPGHQQSKQHIDTLLSNAILSNSLLWEPLFGDFGLSSDGFEKYANLLVGLYDVVGGVTDHRQTAPILRVDVLVEVGDHVGEALKMELEW